MPYREAGFNVFRMYYDWKNYVPKQILVQGKPQTRKYTEKVTVVYIQLYVFFEVIKLQNLYKSTFPRDVYSQLTEV